MSSICFCRVWTDPPLAVAILPASILQNVCDSSCTRNLKFTVEFALTESSLPFHLAPAADRGGISFGRWE